MTMKLPSHLPAEIIAKMTGIPKRSLYNRLIAREVRYIQLFNADRLIDVKDWNRKNDDYLVKE